MGNRIDRASLIACTLGGAWGGAVTRALWHRARVALTGGWPLRGARQRHPVLLHPGFQRGEGYSDSRWCEVR